MKKVIIYRQSFNNSYYEFDLDLKHIEEYMRIPCKECNGGVFYITDDDFFKCIECRGTGYKWVNMY